MLTQEEIGQMIGTSRETCTGRPEEAKDSRRTGFLLVIQHELTEMLLWLQNQKTLFTVLRVPMSL